MIQIDGAFNGSVAQRIVALNSNTRKNIERIEELNRTYADSIAKTHAIGVWRRTMSIAIPVIIATIGLHVHPGVGLTAADWRVMILIGIFLYIVSGSIVWSFWKKDIATSDVSKTLKELLLTQNEIIETVYRVEKMSEKAHDLDAGLPVGDDFELSPQYDLRLQSRTSSYNTLLTISSLQMLRYKAGCDEARSDSALIEKTITGSVYNLADLLTSKPWLGKYYRSV